MQVTKSGLQLSYELVLLPQLLEIFVLLGKGDRLLDEQIHWERRKRIDHPLHLKSEAQISPFVGVQGL